MLLTFPARIATVDRARERALGCGPQGQQPLSEHTSWI